MTNLLGVALLAIMLQACGLLPETNVNMVVDVPAGTFEALQTPVTISYTADCNEEGEAMLVDLYGQIGIFKEYLSDEEIVFLNSELIVAAKAGCAS